MPNKTAVKSCSDEFPSSHAFDVLAATVRFAERCADLTAIYLRHLVQRPKSRHRIEVPKEFALELGAILQIWLWEQAGLREYLDHNLPSSEEAFASLATRTTASPDAYPRYLRKSCRRFCCAAPTQPRASLVWTL